MLHSSANNSLSIASSNKIHNGFRAVGVRLKTATRSSLESHIDATRRDARIKQFKKRAKETAASTLGLKLIESDGAGAHALIAPKDHAVGINATVAKNRQRPG